MPRPTDPTEIAICLEIKDPVLAAYTGNAPQVRVSPNEEASLLQALTKSIISQQLSGKAATSIFDKVINRFGVAGVITSDIMQSVSTQDLKDCGLSRAKASTLVSTANKIANGSIPSQEDMEMMSDTAIVDALTQVKGIGRWTAEMILIFKLGRPDVMPATDLGIQKGYARIFGLKTKPLPRTIIERSRLWQPHRSTVALYCWQAAADAL